MGGGVRRPPASPHGRHRLRCASATFMQFCDSLLLVEGCSQGILMSREWAVLDLAREEFWQEAELPWARNPPKGFIWF